MKKLLNIFIITMGLGIFFLSTPLVSAQSPTGCCEDAIVQDDCCASKDTQDCHADPNSKDSSKDDCGDDCKQCHFCSAHFVVNLLAPQPASPENPHYFLLNFDFGYGISYVTSNVSSIWQPPKIS